MTISHEQVAKASRQLAEQRALVDFDVAEHTIERIAEKYREGEIRASDYQRMFVWTAERMCKVVESVILGLPIQFVFVADVDGKLDIVDGAQRIRTLSDFLHDKLRLQNLELLDELNGFVFSDLPPAEQKRLKHRIVRMIVLSCESNFSIRFEILQRLNFNQLQSDG